MPKFARLVPGEQAAPSSLAIQVGEARLRVETGFDPELLRAVVLALSAAAK
jgi:hypothetical protein